MESTISAFGSMMHGIDKEVKELQSLSLIYAQMRRHAQLSETVDVAVPEGDAVLAVRTMSARVSAIEALMRDFAVVVQREKPLISRALEMKEQIHAQELRVSSLKASMPQSVIDGAAKRKASLIPSAINRSTDFASSGMDRRANVLNEVMSVAASGQHKLSIIADMDCDEPSAKKTKAGSGPRLPAVGDAEFKEVPAYMRGRMALSKINATVDEINAFVENKYAIMNTPSNKLDANNSRKLKDLKKYETAETKGFIHFTEFDLKEFKTLDTTSSKTILPVLRHIGYLREMKTTGKEGWKYWVLQCEN